MPDLVLVQGSGGAIWIMDVPEDGLPLERYLEQRAKGDIVVLPVQVPAEGTPARADLDAKIATGKVAFEVVPVVAVPEPPNMASEAGDSPPDPEIPAGPAGNGSRVEWAAYAESLGLGVDASMGRDDIKAGVAAFLNAPPAAPPAPVDPAVEPPAAPTV